MASAEAVRRTTAVDVVPVVTNVGNVKVASILIAVVVGVSNQRCLVLIVLLVELNMEVPRVSINTSCNDLRDHADSC